MIMSHAEHEIVCVDVEASALADLSYPVEFGWVHDTAAAPESFLVRPTVEWRLNGVWSEESELVHGLALDRLEREGIDVDEACRRLNDASAASSSWWTRRRRTSTGSCGSTTRAR